jgi:hypothetical protein
MSTTPSSGQHPHDSQGDNASDSVDYVKVIAVGVVSLIIFAIATYWAAIILRRETARVQAEAGKSRPVMVGRTEIGIVDQVPFSSDHRIEQWRAAHSAWMHGYGWVDRSKGIAHIPIETAMGQVVAGALPAGAPK